MTIDWTKEHIVKISNEIHYPSNNDLDPKNFRNIIEPWLAALFQSEHLSLLVGSGLPIGLAYISNINSQINSLSNTPGITTLIIDFSSPTTFKLGEQVLKIKTKKINQVSEQLNIINANFTDVDNETYFPTTSGITF